MRAALLTLTLTLAALAGPSAADDAADRERRVRVAMALSTHPEPRQADAADRAFRVSAALDLAAESCGSCRSDLEDCRLESKRTGKPLVVFVGGCESRGTIAAAAGAIPCRVATYPVPADRQAERRVVILYPRGEYLYVLDTLPPTVTPAELLAALAKAAEARDRK